MEIALRFDLGSHPAEHPREIRCGPERGCFRPGSGDPRQSGDSLGTTWSRGFGAGELVSRPDPPRADALREGDRVVNGGSGRVAGGPRSEFPRMKLNDRIATAGDASPDRAEGTDMAAYPEMGSAGCRSVPIPTTMRSGSGPGRLGCSSSGSRSPASSSRSGNEIGARRRFGRFPGGAIGYTVCSVDPGTVAS
jgi:hypothetical protein